MTVVVDFRLGNIYKYIYKYNESSLMTLDLRSYMTADAKITYFCTVSMKNQFSLLVLSVFYWSGAIGPVL